MRLAVLGLLVERPGNPYEVTRRFNERVGDAWGIHRGQVYQAAYALESEGLVERGTAPETRRSSVVFRATSQGRDVFEAWLASDVVDDPSPIRNALFIRLGFLRPEHVPNLLAVVHRREQALLSRIREYSDACPELDQSPGRMDWTGLGFQLILDGSLATLQAELKWLRRVRGTLESLPIAGSGRDDDGTAA